MKAEQGKLILAILGTIGAIAVLMTLFGCAARKPVAYTPAPGVAYETVPGHPSLHYGPLHYECTFSTDCSLVQDWLDKDNKPVLTPGGCLLAKLRITWLLGDRVSMCEKK